MLHNMIGGHLVLIKVVIIYLAKQSYCLVIAKCLAFRLKNTFRLYEHVNNLKMSINFASFKR